MTDPTPPPGEFLSVAANRAAEHSRVLLAKRQIAAERFNLTALNAAQPLDPITFEVSDVRDMLDRIEAELA